jgi:hypothetical protein
MARFHVWMRHRRRAVALHHFDRIQSGSKKHKPVLVAAWRF